MRTRHLLVCVAALSLVATASSAATIETVTPIGRVYYTESGGACPFFGSSGEAFCASEYEVGLLESTLESDPNTLAVQGFDPALGTLESVELILSVQDQRVTSHSAYDGTPSDSGTVSLRLSREIALVDSSGDHTLPDTRVAAGFYQSRPVCTPLPCTLSWENDATTSAVITEDLSRFVGPDVIVFATAGWYSLVGPAYTSDRSSPQPTATQLRTIYTYVPESGTGLLMALGLALLVTRQGRRM